MGGHQNQDRSGRRFLKHLEQGIACCRIHCLGIGNNHDPHSGFIRFHGKGLAEGANLIYFYERPGRFEADDVRMIIGFNFAA